MGGRIDVGYLIKNLSVRHERDEAVREALRHQDLVALLGRYFEGDPFAKGLGAAADVDDDVEDPAADHAQQLVLGARRKLVVKSPDHAGGGGIGVIVLHETEIDAGLGEALGVIALYEIATRVVKIASG